MQNICAELRYTSCVVDLKEVHGKDFPSETFRVLKEKEVRLYGEYRTSRLVLTALQPERPDELARIHFDLQSLWTGSYPMKPAHG